MDTFLGILAIFCILIIMFGMLAMISSPIGHYEPMEYEEEIKWLMEFGLTREEAEEIAHL